MGAPPIRNYAEMSFHIISLSRNYVETPVQWEHSVQYFGLNAHQTCEYWLHGVLTGRASFRFSIYPNLPRCLNWRTNVSLCWVLISLELLDSGVFKPTITFNLFFSSSEPWASWPYYLWASWALWVSGSSSESVWVLPVKLLYILSWKLVFATMELLRWKVGG